MISAIHFGHAIIQDNQFLSKKYILVYAIILLNLWLILSLMKHHATSNITPFLVIISIGLLIIIDARKAILTSLIGFLTMVIFFVILVVFINVLFTIFTNHRYFFFIIFILLNVIALILNFFITKHKSQDAIQRFWKKNINIGIIFAGTLMLIIAISSNFFRKYIAGISINISQLFSIIFFIIIISVIIFLFNSHKHQLVNERLMKKAELSNELSNYVMAIKSSRHEYNSHLVTINQLTTTKQYSELSKYVKSLVQENDYLQSVAAVKYPEISALLYRHEVFAKTNQINFEIFLNSNLAKINLSLYDLNKLLNNVLSNALEASLQSNNVKERYVEISFNQVNKKNIITVINNGHIPNTVATKIRKPGVTSKKSTEHGFGLSIIEKIIHDYNGSFSIQEKDKHVIVEITI